MAKLILMRHGDYSGSFLTEEGRRDVLSMAKALAGTLSSFSPETVRVISSTSPRAIRSAAIVAEVLGLFYGRDDQFDALRAEGQQLEQPQALAGVIDHIFTGVDIIIALTHYPVCADFPEFYSSHRELKPMYGASVQYAECVIIDLDLNSVSQLRQLPRF